MTRLSCLMVLILMVSVLSCTAGDDDDSECGGANSDIETCAYTAAYVSSTRLDGTLQVESYTILHAPPDSWHLIPSSASLAAGAQEVIRIGGMQWKKDSSGKWLSANFDSSASGMLTGLEYLNLAYLSDETNAESQIEGSPVKGEQTKKFSKSDKEYGNRQAAALRRAMIGLPEPARSQIANLASKLEGASVHLETLVGVTSGLVFEAQAVFSGLFFSGTMKLTFDYEKRVDISPP